MHGKYLHLAYWRDYIIFSNRRLSEKELLQINNVAPSSELIKIKNSEKTYNKLIAILPQHQKMSVAAIKPSDGHIIQKKKQKKKKR